MQLVLDTNGLIMKKRNKSFLIHTKTKSRLISPKRVDSILLTKDVLLTASAMRLAIKNQIPIIIMNAYGGVEGRLWQSGYGTDAEIRRNQVIFLDHTEALNWCISLLLTKNQHQIDNLNYLKERRKSKSDAIQDTIAYLTVQELKLKEKIKAKVLTATIRNEIMGLEGSIARQYWQTISNSLPPEYYFAKRSRRPAKDHFNASLNYLYGMLYAVVEGAAIAAGLDTQFGVLHADNYNKPTLCYDLIEPFRPWIDRLLIQEYMKKNVKATYFNTKNEGVYLCKLGKKHFIPLFHELMDSHKIFEGKKMSVRNHINVFAGSFSTSLKNMKL